MANLDWMLGVAAVLAMVWVARAWGKERLSASVSSSVSSSVPASVPASASPSVPASASPSVPTASPTRPVVSLGDGPRRRGRQPTAFGRDVDEALSRVVGTSSMDFPRDTRPAEDAPYDREDVMRVMSAVVSRINRAAPSLDLRLVSVDGVRKAVDAGTGGAGTGGAGTGGAGTGGAGTATYEGHITAFSVRRNVAVKLFVVADVSGTTVVPRQLVQGSVPLAKDDDTLLAAGAVDTYAAFQPALRV